MSDPLPVPTQTHAYVNLRTGDRTTFGFRRTAAPHVRELVTPEGDVIGTWNRHLNMFYMLNGISNHTIEHLDPPTRPEAERPWHLLPTPRSPGR